MKNVRTYGSDFADPKKKCTRPFAEDYEIPRKSRVRAEYRRRRCLTTGARIYMHLHGFFKLSKK